MINKKEIINDDEVVGISFSFSEMKQHPMFGMQKHSMTVWIINGEIQYACLIEGNISRIHNIHRNWYISNKDKNERWTIVEEILTLFLELSKEDYDLLYNSLNYDSIGFKLAERVLNNKIDDLNKQLVELNNIKEISDIFNQSKKQQQPVKKLTSINK